LSLQPAFRTWHWLDPVEPVRELLAGGGLVVIPTESSYGLAVDPRNRRGVEAVYAIKGREAGKPLPVVAADREQLVALGVDPDLPQLALALQVWPAALSVVLPIREPLAATAGQSTLAARIPAHAALRSWLGRLGSAVTATSANLSGEPPVLDPSQLGGILQERTLQGRWALVIDDGVLPGGPPSTLVEWRSTEARPRILRAGAFAVERLPGAAAAVETYSSR